jgi:hypothetical protein
VSKGTDKSRWASSLRHLRQRFSNAADQYAHLTAGKTLNLVLMHSSPPHPSFEREWLNHITKDVDELFELSSQDKAITEMGRSGSLTQSDPPAYRSLLFSLRNHLDDALWGTWENLLSDAGYAIYNSPFTIQDYFKNVLADVRPDEYGVDNDLWEENAWIWALFEIAWTLPRCSPLRAERRLYIPGFTDVAYELESVISFAEYLPHDLTEWAVQLPDVYYSVLRDVYNSSVYFIDWLVAESEYNDSQPLPLRHGQLADVTESGLAVLVGSDSESSSVRRVTRPSWPTT